MVSRKPGGRVGEQSTTVISRQNYTQIRTALQKIAFRWIKTAVLKENSNNNNNGVFANSLLCRTQLPVAKAAHESKLNLK